MKTINNAIVDYNAAKLCCLPASKSKKMPTVGSWKKYQKQLPSQSEINSWTKKENDGLCLICGGVSGNLEIIDFDCSGELFNPWVKLVPQELFDKLAIEKTPSGGFHVIYRSETAIEGNQKLASRKKGKSIETMIETRGEGGLCLVSPGDGYVLKQGDIRNLPKLTADEREDLLSYARQLNEHFTEDKPATQYNSSNNQHNSSETYIRPGDDFTNSGDITTCLTNHGWKCEMAGENSHWCRPGKDSGTSATVRDGVFYCFSSNAHPFESNRGYSFFNVYTLLEHNGNFSQAAQALRQRGYGCSSYRCGGRDIEVVKNTEDSYIEDEDEFTENKPLDKKTKQLLYDIPGFMGDVIDFCMETAPCPNRPLALAGALAMQSYLCGRKVSCMNICPNLYILALAPSTTGKEHPRQVNAHIMGKINKIEALSDKIASGEGLIDAMNEIGGAMLNQYDEFDSELIKIKKDKSSNTESLTSLLLSLYTSANSMYSTRLKVGVKQRHIIRPHLTIFGTATPVSFYQSLSPRVLNSGLFARMLIIEADPKHRGQRSGKLSNMPDSIIEQAWYWANLVSGDEVIDIPVLPEIEAKLDGVKDLSKKRYDKAIADGNEVAATAWGRWEENGIKLAMLYACSRNPKNPIVDNKAMGWGLMFTGCLIEQQLEMLKTHNSISSFHADCQRFIERLRKSPSSSVPRSKMLKYMKCKSFDFNQIADTLKERNEIIVQRDEGKTKPTICYRLNYRSKR
jgi:hypothetical protein